jgi:hypothetical protein
MIALEHHASTCFAHLQLSLSNRERDFLKRRKIGAFNARVSMCSRDTNELRSSEVTQSRRGVLQNVAKKAAAFFTLATAAKSAPAMDWIPEAPKEGSCAGLHFVCVIYMTSNVMRQHLHGFLHSPDLLPSF